MFFYKCTQIKLKWTQSIEMHSNANHVPFDAIKLLFEFCISHSTNWNLHRISLRWVTCNEICFQSCIYQYIGCIETLRSFCKNARSVRLIKIRMHGYNLQNCFRSHQIASFNNNTKLSKIVLKPAEDNFVEKLAEL